VKGKEERGGVRRKQGERAAAAVSYDNRWCNNSTVPGALQCGRLAVGEGENAREGKGKEGGKEKDTENVEGSILPHNL